MTFSILCLIVATVYAVIWFFDAFFKSCMHYPYFAFLEGTGLKIGFLNITWTTTTFNRAIYRLSIKFSRYLEIWYTIGYYVTIGVFLPYALWIMPSLIYRQFTAGTEVNKPNLEVVVPGVNIPTSDIWFYFTALGFSTITHELGHALAASQYEVQVLGVGMSIITIMPMAFVQLNTDHLNNLAINKRLKIICAGVWHNLSCAFLAVLLYFSVPMLFSIGYTSEIGVRVVGFQIDSPLKDMRGLETKDIIISLNGCEVKNMRDWMYCLQKAHDRFGMCASDDFVSNHDEMIMEKIKEHDVVECCRKMDTSSLCFEFMEPKLPSDSSMPSQYSCLQPRQMLMSKFIKCTEAEGYACPTNMECLQPSLNNWTYFMIIDRKDKTPVIYLGLANDLQQTVYVDPYFPKYSIFRSFSPLQFEKLLYYICVFSMGIAFLNVMPIYGADGHHITRNLISLLAVYLDKDGHFVFYLTSFIVSIGSMCTVTFLMYLFINTFFFA